MNLWKFISGDWGEEYAKMVTEIKQDTSVRAAFYPVNPNEVTVKEAPIPLNRVITFEEIQTSIKEEIKLINTRKSSDYDDKLVELNNEVNNKNLEIISLEEQINKFKKDNENIYNKIEELKNLGLINLPSTTKLVQDLKDSEKEIKLKIERISNSRGIISDKIQNINKQIVELENVKKLSQQYTLEYPTFKFIDTKSFINILKKYKLVLADSCFYNKKIPENVLSNILKFKDKIENSKQHIHIVKDGWSNYRKTVTTNSIFSDQYGSEKSIYYYPVTDLVIAAPLSHFKIEHLKIQERDISGTWNEANVPLFNVDENRNLVLNLDAINDIQKRNLEISRKLDDPIAILKVKGGFIIIDAWEKEALIPELDRKNLN
jgi:hypothetical protein